MAARTTSCLLLLFITSCAVGANAEASSEDLKGWMQDISRRSSGISENVMALQHTVQELANNVTAEAAKVDKVLTSGQEAAGITVNVRNTVSQIRDDLGALDDLVATSKGNNASLRNVEEGLRKVTSLVDGVSDQLGAVQQALNGIRRRKVVWYAENVQKAIENATVSGKGDTLSREFTVDGYRARLRVHVSSADNETWLGTFLSLCPHADDDFLQWPFVTPFTLSFVHPTNASKDENHDVLLEDLAGDFIQAVQKPQGKCSDRWIGFKEIRKVDDLKQAGFKLGAGISVAVELHP